MIVLLTLFLFLTPFVHSQSLRIENEHKLTFPCDKTDLIWDYLKSRYANDPNQLYLNKISSGFSAIQSVEHFKDVYFDDSSLSLLNREGAVRRRYRLFPDNPSHRKHKRSLVQIKLRRESEQITNRSEIKFGVRKKFREVPETAKPDLIVKNVAEFQEILLKETGINSSSLATTLVLNQVRRRIYLSKNGIPFATLTEDDVTVSKWLVPLRFCEMELELNEILYTSSSAEERGEMQIINDELKSDLEKKFTFFKVDQTPKYNKAFNAYKEKIPFFEKLLKFTHGIL